MLLIVCVKWQLYGGKYLMTADSTVQYLLLCGGSLGVDLLSQPDILVGCGPALIQMFAGIAEQEQSRGALELVVGGVPGTRQ